MVDKLYCSIAHEHKKKFLASPTEHPTVRLLMRAIRRRLARPRQPVEPLQPAHLQTINQHLITLGCTAPLELWRTSWRANILYYSACRFGEINALTTSDLSLQFDPTPLLTLQIRQSKTDQLHEGLTKYVHGNPDNPLLCPVQLTKNYLNRLSQHLPKTVVYQGYLQPRVRLDRSLNIQVPLPDQRVSYTSCLDETRQLFTHLQIPGRFGEHSGRRGAATQAAANGGSLLEIQTLGNWKQAANAQLYIDRQSQKNPQLSKLLLPKI